MAAPGVLAAQLVKTLVDRDVAPVIRERVALGERFAGFGHGVYKHGDPRAHALLEALARAGAAEKLTREIPERIAEATGEFVNIDYALAVLVHTLGLPPGNELVLFAMARTVGLDRACQRTIAAWRTDPPPRALYRSGAGAQPGLQQVMRDVVSRICLSKILSNRLRSPARSRPRHAGGGSSRPPARRSARRQSPTSIQ